jgi:hypothetical protein
MNFRRVALQETLELLEAEGWDRTSHADLEGTIGVNDQRTPSNSAAGIAGAPARFDPANRASDTNNSYVSFKDDEILRRLADRIDQSIRRNIPLEIAIILLLVIVSLVGVSLLVTGIIESRWERLAAGLACQAAIVWPINRLLEMRRFNASLKVLPEMFRVAKTDAEIQGCFESLGTIVDSL